MLKATNNTTRLLELLVKILGSADEARVALRCSEMEFDQWIGGIAEPSLSAFQRMVDIIVLYQSKEIADHRTSIQKLRAGPSRTPGTIEVPSLCLDCIGLVGAGRAVEPHERMRMIASDATQARYECGACAAFWVRERGWSRR